MSLSQHPHRATVALVIFEGYSSLYCNEVALVPHYRADGHLVPQMGLTRSSGSPGPNYRPHSLGTEITHA